MGLAVITGASAGIGQAVARRMAERGMDVALGARRMDRLESLAAEIQESHEVTATPFSLDVTDSKSVESFVAGATEMGGEEGISVLVNNAGLAKGVAPLTEAPKESEADWDIVIDTNVKGVLRVTRGFIGGMKDRGRGLVVNLGSIAGLWPYEGGAVYCASKAAVHVLTRVLRKELLGSGVRVTCIQPGLVETEFSEVRFSGDQEHAAKPYAGMTPLTANDIAEAIDWVVGLPAHMNIEDITLMPTDQVSAQKVHRTSS